MKKKTDTKKLQYKNVIINDDKNAEYFLGYLKPFISAIEEENIDSEFEEVTVTFGFLTTVVAWNAANVIKITSYNFAQAFDIAVEPFMEMREVFEENIEQIQDLICLRLFQFNECLFSVENLQVAYKNKNIHLNVKTRDIDEEYLLEQLADMDIEDGIDNYEDDMSITEAFDLLQKDYQSSLKNNSKQQPNNKIHKLK